MPRDLKKGAFGNVFVTFEFKDIWIKLYLVKDKILQNSSRKIHGVNWTAISIF